MRFPWIFGLIVALGIAFTAVPASAQYTIVTAQVKDSNGKLYSNCTVNASFIPSPTATTEALINGSVFQTTIPAVRCDSSGNFTIIAVDNNQVSDGHTGPLGSQWNFNVVSDSVCFAGQIFSFSTALTITGPSQNISILLTAAAPVLPSCGGGGGGGGGITSVGLSGPAGIPIAGSPVVSSGTLGFSMPTGWTTGSLLLGNGPNSVTNLPIGPATSALISNGATASWQVPAGILNTCMIVIGDDNSMTPLTTGDIQPQRSQCYAPTNATMVSAIAMVNTGASTVRIGYRSFAATTPLTGVLTPTVVAGITDPVACANVTGASMIIEGVLVTCSTLTNTTLLAGQYIETIGGAADGTSTRVSIAVTFVVPGGSGGGGGGSGGVSSFSSGNLSPLFTTSVATPTTTPSQSFSLSNAAQNSVLAGPASGGAGAPTYQTGPTLTTITTTGLATHPMIQFPLQASPGNPPSGSDRIYADSTTGNITCLTSLGANCLPSGGGVTLQTNNTNNSSQTIANFINGAAFNGLTPTFSNPAGGNIQLGFTGTLGNAGLTNSSVTLNGQTVALGASGTIPFQVNATPLTSQAGVNFLTSAANSCGLVATPSNPATNGVRWEITGTLTTACGAGGTNQINGSNLTTQSGINFLTSSANTCGLTITPSNPATNQVRFETAGTLSGCGALSNPMTTLGDMIYGGASGTPTRLAGPTGVNGVPRILISTPAAGAATAPTLSYAGVPVNNNSETTCASLTLNALDRASFLNCSGTSTATITFPIHTTAGFGVNYPIFVCNNNSGNMTLTPTTDTIDSGTLLPAWCDHLFNNSSGNWQSAQVPAFTAFGSTCSTIFTWSTTAGFGCTAAPALGAATATSLLATGIVDGLAPVTITTGTTANLGATYNTGYTLNHEGTAATGVTYTLPATSAGKQYCVKNSGTTGVVNTGVLTVYPPASSYVIYNGVVNTIGGGGTHGMASGGAAGDGACFVAIDSTHWEVFVQSGTWTEN